jgi:hypothetical protein
MQPAAKLVEKILDAAAVMSRLHGNRLHDGQQVLGAVADFTQQCCHSQVARKLVGNIGDHCGDACLVGQQAGLEMMALETLSYVEFDRLIRAAGAAPIEGGCEGGGDGRRQNVHFRPTDERAGGPGGRHIFGEMEAVVDALAQHADIPLPQASSHDAQPHLRIAVRWSGWHGGETRESVGNRNGFARKGEAVSEARPKNRIQARRKKLMTSDITRKARNRKNRIWAMPAEAPAMPPKPRTPAIRAITRKTKA